MKYRIIFCLALAFWLGNLSLLQSQNLAWDYQDMMTDLQQSGANPDMISDASGNLYVSFWDNLGRRLGYAYREKSTHIWTISFPDPTIIGGYKSAIALDANNKVHIAYYKNVNGLAFLQYLTNKSGSWVSAGVDDTMELGKYGVNTTVNEVFQPSVDIAIQANGSPFIVCFDGTYQSNSANPSSCQYINYDLDIFYAYKTGSTWSEGRMPNIPSQVPGYCDLQGDRFGEFLTIIPANGGGFNVFANSYFNRKPSVFKSAGNDLTTWNYFALDSINRDIPITLSSGFEAFEDISVAAFPGSDSVAMMYGFSDMYGLGSVTNQARFYFARVKHSALGTPAYSAFYKKMNATQNSVRCSKFAVAPHSANDVYFSYYVEQTGRVVVGKTLFAGVGFVYDTLATGFFTNAKINLYKSDDSLFVLLFDAYKNRMTMAVKKLTDISNATIPWVWENITKTESSGNDISAQSVPNANGDVLQVAFSERTDSDIFYGIKNGSAAWVYSQVNPVGTLGVQPKLALNTASPYLVYVDKNTEILKGAKKTGNNWVTESITQTPLRANEPAIAIRNSTIYVAFQDKIENALMFATAPWGTSTWTVSLIDSASAKTGRISDIQIDNTGTIHIAYLNETDRSVMYAYKTASGAWIKQIVTAAQIYDPVSISLQVNSAGTPYIAFYALDEAQINLAETDGSGNWAITTVMDFGSNSLQGNPLKLRIDDLDRLWLLYNYPTPTSYELRLARREYGTGQWFAVSVVNNQGQVANSFDFNLADKDFYIFGRKNWVGTPGIAYLYAANGVSTEIAAQAIENAYQFTAFPNPAAESIAFSFLNPTNQAVKLSVYTITGQEIAKLEDKAAAVGKVSFQYDCDALPKGIYFCKWEINHRTFIRKWVK